MKKLKSTTIVKRLADLAEEVTAEEARHAFVKNDISEQVSNVQERCAHQVDAEWHDHWDGWDDHEDLKGYYNYQCKVCKKILKREVVKTEHRRIWQSFKEQYE